jgi:hypothetical protein
MVEKIITYRIFVEEPEGKTQFGKLRHSREAIKFGF